MRDNNNTSSDEGTIDDVAEDQQFDGEEVEAVETEEYTFDDLLGLTEEDDPEFTDEANHRGMKPLKDWLPHIPEDVRKHLANFRADYTRKTQELAAERKQIEALKAELLSTKEGTLNSPMLEEMSRHITDEEHDIYSEEGMKAEIKRQAALMLNEMIKPAQEQIKQERRQMELEAFKADNPELTQDEYRLPIAKMLMERPELKLEDAFYIVKARVDAAKTQAEREEIARQKTSRKETYGRTSTGKNTAKPQPPKTRDAWELYNFYKNNPDAMPVKGR